MVDGDTVHLSEFDYGREHNEKNVSLRLCNPDWSWLDTWEIRSRPRNITDEEWEEHKRKGQEAKAYVESVLPEGQEITILTNRDKDGTFRDLAGAIFVRKEDGKWLDLAAGLKERGHLKS